MQGLGICYAQCAGINSYSQAVHISLLSLPLGARATGNGLEGRIRPPGPCVLFSKRCSADTDRLK